MKPSILLGSLIVAVLALLATPDRAQSNEARATSAVNVRSGPGASFAVIDTLTRGERVEMSECQTNGWCYITHAGPDGWVSSRYLEATGSSSDPNCSFRLVLGSGGKPRFELVCGDAIFPDLGPTLGVSRVCFYDGPNYTGASFCRGPGTYNSLPPSRNDRVSSIRLYGNAKAQVCANPNQGAFCRNITISNPRLGAFLNNKISSMRVTTGSLPTVRQVCFFNQTNFNTSAPYFCRRAGRAIQPLPPAFNNRIDSVWPFGGAYAVLCDNGVFGVGPCVQVHSKRNLPPTQRNRASSLRVFN